MSTLTVSMPWIVAFVAAFALASLVSGFTYWVARRPSEVVRVVKGVSSTLSLCALFSLLVGSVIGHFVGPALFFVLVLVATSGVQVLIERSLQGEPVAVKAHFFRSFFSYLCCAFVLFLIAGALVLTQWDFLVRLIGPAILIPLWVEHLSAGPYRLLTGSPGIQVWALCLSTALYGLLAGWVFAPLSISFYRLLFQNIRLRPGVDRPLQHGDLIN